MPAKATRKKNKSSKSSSRRKGTRRSSARKKRRQRSFEWPDLSWMLHPILWGVLLFLFALLTAGTLVSPDRGPLLLWWNERVRHLVGSAIVLVPVVAAASGWWLMRMAIAEEEPNPETTYAPSWRILGSLMVLVAVTGALHLLSFSPDPEALAQKGEGGGSIGWIFSDLLVRNLGFWLSIPVIGLTGFVGLVLALDITPAEVVRALDRLRRFLTHRPVTPSPAEEAIWEPIPTVEPAEAYLPWWRQLWGKLRGRSRAAEQPPLPTRVVGTEPGDAGPVISTYTPVEPPEPAPLPLRTATTTPGSPVTAATASTSSPAAPRPAQPLGAGSSDQIWQLPNIREIFEDPEEGEIGAEEIRQRSRIIEETLAAFGVPVRVVEVNQGPAVTQFGIQPGYIEKVDRKSGTVRREKVKVARILALQNDLALALAAAPIRIEAPVPGKPIVGIEVPNKRTALVTLRSVLESDAWRTFKGRLKIALGRDVAGRPVVADLTRMPHLLIAGATGSGKSVCINAIITCLAATHVPDEVRFILVDPKRVELTIYEGVPHLIGNVITDVDMVVNVLHWAVREMERRYELFAQHHVRDITRYNKQATPENWEHLPYIVIIVDELADLMLSAPDEVEHAVVRLAQMARATGIHLVLATQRPSVDVVTGLIKANFPARISFAVTSQVDSRVILDSPGAEQLLGQGDMLFLPPDSSKLARLQGVYVSDREIQRLVEFWRRQRPAPEPPLDGGEEEAPSRDTGARPASRSEEEDRWKQAPLWDELLGDVQAQKAQANRDPLFDEAVRVVREARRASISLLQRRLRIGYARAGRLIDELEEAGIIGPDPGGGRSRAVYPGTQERSGTAEEKAPPREGSREFPSETPGASTSGKT
jgi:DNA segregation ATPase FtsK/SpoIIIE and related proteins